nr:MAG TPA: hypothetical protein [Caudoviricetes sp.]
MEVYLNIKMSDLRLKCLIFYIMSDFRHNV